jgi:hypothetical protein
MSTAVVQRHRPILPAFNLLLAGGALVVSAIAIADHVGSTTPTQTKQGVTVSVSHTPSVTGCMRKVKPTC